MAGSYVVLARKYRPQTFEDVVGQNAVSQTLLNAVTSNRVAHAYVFSGPRGVGKTTTARILAKCLNCVKGPTKTPCNECDACISISQSNSTDDVLEIDGASNRGIEQIRDLRDSAKYTPARSRYRIYIIDEAHQITKDAFGALLKTLEEPPAHVVFMLATTEVQKIPAPILSRCQRFALRPISAELVFKHLKEICAEEKIPVVDEALADIVRFVEGSMRDALSLLDQAIVFAPEGITSHTIRDLLGLLPFELVRTTAQLVQAGDPATILKHASEAVNQGVDLTQLAKDLQNFYHNALLAKAGVEDAFKVDTNNMKQEAASFEFATLERNIRLLSRALEEMRHSETPRAVFEIALLRLGQKTIDPRALLDRLDKLEKAGPTSVAPPVKPMPTAVPSPFRVWVAEGRERATSAPPSLNPVPALSPTPAAALTPTLSLKGEGAEEAPPVGNSGLEQAYADFLRETAKTKASLATGLENAQVRTDENRLTLVFDKKFHHDMVLRSKDTIVSDLSQRTGRPVAVEFKIEAAPAQETAHAAARPAPPPPSARPSLREEADDRFEELKPQDTSAEIQKALKHFPGAVKREKKT
jgi:DNA polymerase-3 subunit gamma/tau